MDLRKEELYGFCHGAYIGTEVVRVCSLLLEGAGEENPAGVIHSDICSKPSVGNNAYSCAHLLNDRHERESERGEPKELEAKLRALLGVSGNA
jgi:hypothetical protein